MVFQNYALYPHMTVYDNMGFSMKLAGRGKEEIRQRVDVAAKILGLTEYLERYPRQLSGGQRQRVAMGRAIVRDPQVFLFDEPLSNLDAKLRVQMRTEIKELHQRLKTTSVYVTHDQIEAMTMADKIVVMNGGNVEQIGSPLELYDNPANLFVAGFIGSPAMNFLPCRLQSGSPASVELSNGTGCLHLRAIKPMGREVTVGVRPEHALIDEAGVPAEVVLVEPTGADTQVYLQSVRHGCDGGVARAPYTSSPARNPAADPMPGKTLPVRAGHRQATGVGVHRRDRFGEDMSRYSRRDFLKSTAGVAAGAALGRLAAVGDRCAPASCSSSPSPRPSCGCCAGSASYRAMKTCGWRIPRNSPMPTGIDGARRQRELGRYPAEGRGRCKHRQRPRHHSFDQ